MDNIKPPPKPLWYLVDCSNDLISRDGTFKLRYISDDLYFPQMIVENEIPRSRYKDLTIIPLSKDMAKKNTKMYKLVKFDTIPYNND